MEKHLPALPTPHTGHIRQLKTLFALEEWADTLIGLAVLAVGTAGGIWGVAALATGVVIWATAQAWRGWALLSKLAVGSFWLLAGAQVVTWGADDTDITGWVYLVPMLSLLVAFPMFVRTLTRSGTEARTDVNRRIFATWAAWGIGIGGFFGLGVSATELGLLASILGLLLGGMTALMATLIWIPYFRSAYPVEAVLREQSLKALCLEGLTHLPRADGEVFKGQRNGRTVRVFVQTALTTARTRIDVSVIVAKNVVIRALADGETSPVQVSDLIGAQTLWVEGLENTALQVLLDRGLAELLPLIHGEGVTLADGTLTWTFDELGSEPADLHQTLNTRVDQMVSLSGLLSGLGTTDAGLAIEPDRVRSHVSVVE